MMNHHLKNHEILQQVSEPNPTHLSSYKRSFKHFLRNEGYKIFMYEGRDNELLRDIEAVFIDRDGTIGGDGHFIHPSDFKPYPFSKAALERLKENNMKRFACTNQRRISRGEATLRDFQREFSSVGFDDAFICPHNPSEECLCHKPNAGLLHEASKKHHVDLTKTAFI